MSFEFNNHDLTEARTGFRACNEGPRGDREAKFVLLRQKMARGETWGPELIDSALPKAGGSK